jgi:secreted trypsin-like serine protease
MILILLASFVALAVAVPPAWYSGPCGSSKYADAGSMPLMQRGGNMIVGGVEARAHEFPWQTSMRRKSTNSHFCGGSIINDLWIATASHCMDGETPSILSVVIGDHTRNEVNAVRESKDVAAIYMHPNYNSRTLVNDIALVKLASPITFSADIQPVCGPEQTDLFVSQKSTCSGWGTTSSGGTCCPQTLRYVSLNVTTNAYCDSIYTRDDVTEDMICATDNSGSNERDSCQGDSGGPLMVKGGNGEFSLVGIVSWGIGCASGYPGVYSRVTHFNDWILETIKL